MKSSSLLKAAKLVNARFLTQNSPIYDINGLVAWYEATSKDSFLSAAQMIDDAQIDEWYNINPITKEDYKNQNKLTKIASADTTYQRDGINDIPGIKFSNNSNSPIKLTNFFQGDVKNATIFVVFKAESVNSTPILLDSNTGSTMEIGLNSSNIFADTGNSGTTNNGTFDDISINVGNILTAYLGSDDTSFYLNNTTQKSTITNSLTKDGTLVGLVLGGATNTSEDEFSGIISEVIIYDRALKGNDRKSIMRYLSKKYNIKIK